MTIIQKIHVSEQEDIALVIKEISAINNDAELLKAQLSVCLALEQKQKEEIDYLKNKDKNSYIYGNIITPLPGLMLMTYGFIEMGKGNTDSGWRWFEAGAITLVGMEIVFQGGKWIFRIW